MATTLRGDRIVFPSSGSNPSSPSAGQIYYNSTDKRLYIYDGTAWGRISSGVDEGPVFSTEPNETYSFVPGGSAFNISVTAADPEGFPVTYSYATYPTNQSQFSVSQSGSTFTITPNSSGSNAGTSKLRIKASDGTHVTSITSEMTLKSYNGYADEYVALTGGTITEVTYTGSGMSLNSIVDAASDGDAILLPAGSYNLTATVGDGSSQDAFRNKEIAIVGKTFDPKDVVVTSVAYGNRDKNIWVMPYTNSNGTSYKNHLANLRFIRNANSTTNYVAAMKRFNSAGYARNVIFDMGGSTTTWIYDNSNSATPYVTYENCSFLNYSNWNGNYNGNTGSNRVKNCAFSSTYNGGSTFIGTNQASVSFAATTYTYSNSSSYGHLKDIYSTPTVSISSPV